MKVGYFPGCSLSGTGIEYDESLKAIANEFGIEFEEVRDWNCCGATAAHSLNKLLSLALPARTLAIAELQGFDELLVPCAACYSRMLTAWHEIKFDESLKYKISDIIEMHYTARLRPSNILEFLQKYIMPGIKDKITTHLNTKTACYYGCLLVRPPKLVNYDKYEDPDIMENMIKTLGGQPIDWAFKTECCGAGLSVARTDIVGKLSGKIVGDALDRGAEVIVVACPMCQSNLDMRRDSINTYLNQKTDIPILFITQAIGLAMGLDEKVLGLQRLFIPFDKKLLIKPVVKSQIKSKPEKIGQEV